jgi:hypothetical protein
MNGAGPGASARDQVSGLGISAVLRSQDCAEASGLCCVLRPALRTKPETRDLAEALRPAPFHSLRTQSARNATFGSTRAARMAGMALAAAATTNIAPAANA